MGGRTGAGEDAQKRLDLEEHESGLLQRRSWSWTDGINSGSSGASRKGRNW
jgi:hypothetical protein